MKEVLASLGPEVLANHAVLVQQVLVPKLNCVQLLLQPRDVLFLGNLHLFEDFLLGVELAVEIFCPCNCLVHLVLELQVLLLQNLNLAVGRVELDLRVFQGQNLVLQLAASLQQT